jgi:hypothetical protein
VTFAAVVALAGCTDGGPEPAPTPTPADTSEPAPSGVQVAVVLPPPGERAELPLVDVEQRLEQFAEDRVGDVAGVRVVRTDDPSFVSDTAAYLADGGTDLVCVLGTDGARTVIALADRFPATRFCALGTPGDDLPDTVDLFDVADEQIGHLLGVATAELTGEDPAAIALGGDDEGREQRRAGARAALAGSTLAVDAEVADADEAVEVLGQVRGSGDAPPAAVLVDTASASLAELLADLAPVVVAPADPALDRVVAVTWGVRIEVIVGAAVDRLVAPDDADPVSELGFAQQVFSVSFGEEVPVEVRDRLEVVADELGRGTRDPLRALSPAPSPSPTEGTP